MQSLPIFHGNFVSEFFRETNKCIYQRNWIFSWISQKYRGESYQFSRESTSMESSVSIFQGIFANVGGNFLIWRGGGAEWALDYNSIKFWGFPNILYFPKILSFGNSLDNLYIPCLILIITFRFTCGERKICQTSKIPKYYDHDCR